MTNSRKTFRVAAAGAAFVGVAIAGVLAGAGAATGTTAPEAVPSPAAGAPALKVTTPKFMENARGETYGSAMAVVDPADEPDLILAEATNGKTGYVRASELDAASGADISAPAEARAWTSKLKATKSERVTTIPVYLSDGRTVIGVFEITNPEAPAEAVESR